MTPKQRKAHVADIQTFLESKGYEADRFGHYKKTTEKDHVLRYKFGKVALRYEVKDARGSWLRIASGPVSRVEVTPDGLKGLKR